MASTKEKEGETPKKTSGETYKLPGSHRLNIGELLAHGDPATRHLPKTWKDELKFPLVLCVVFFISLLTFHYAPHSKSTHPGFKLPQQKARFEAIPRKEHREPPTIPVAVEEKTALEEEPPLPPSQPEQEQQQDEVRDELPEVPVATAEDQEPPPKQYESTEPEPKVKDIPESVDGTPEEIHQPEVKMVEQVEIKEKVADADEL